MAGFRDKYEWIYPAPLLDLIQTLSPELAGTLMQAIFSYSRTGNKMPVPIEAELLYDYICRDIDLKGKAYEDMCEKKRENGKLGGAPKGNQNASKSKNNQTTNRLKNNQTTTDRLTDRQSDSQSDSQLVRTDRKTDSMTDSSDSAPQQVPSEKELLLAEYYDYRNNWDVCNGKCPSWEDWKKQREVENV